MGISMATQFIMVTTAGNVHTPSDPLRKQCDTDYSIVHSLCNLILLRLEILLHVITQKYTNMVCSSVCGWRVGMLKYRDIILGYQKTGLKVTSFPAEVRGHTETIETSCSNVIVPPYTWTTNQSHLPQKGRSRVKQGQRSYSLCKTHFIQYQASSAALGWPGDGWGLQ